MSRTLKTILIVIGLPVLFALIVRWVYGIELNGWNEIYRVMSISFLFILPVIIGTLTIYLARSPQTKKLAYKIFIPWIPIFVFLVITILFEIEGWACWLMMLPIFLAGASLGGIIGGYLKKEWRNDKLNISILILLPFLIGPLESLIDNIPGSYKAYTYIDIDAPADKIWDNVTRVYEIPEKEDSGYLNKALGFPRPVKAELNFEGEGAYRKAIFTNGLVFHETVTNYKDKEKMVFDIKAYPHEIPSTTLDKHVVIGGDYFDVLEGTYELEKLDNGKNRLHLYSYFKMNTTFNFYAGWWAKWIMKDIQNNILKVQKQRSED